METVLDVVAIGMYSDILFHMYSFFIFGDIIGRFNLGGKIMNTNRAQQILESTKDIEVQHNGASIWIQNVNPEEGTARIYPRQNPEQEMTVSINELQEK